MKIKTLKIKAEIILFSRSLKKKCNKLKLIIELYEKERRDISGLKPLFDGLRKFIKFSVFGKKYYFEMMSDFIEVQNILNDLYYENMSIHEIRSTYDNFLKKIGLIRDKLKQVRKNI